MNEPRKLPDGWKRGRLGEVCEVIMGQSPHGHTYNKEGKGIPFYQGKINFGKIYLRFPSTWCTEPTKIAEPGDILMSVRAPVGPTNLCTEKCCIGRGLAAIRPKKEVDSWFVFYYLRSIESEISKLGSGSTFSAISKSQICNLQISLPPIETQRRIATYLKEKMSYVENLQSQILNLQSTIKALPQSILRKTFRGEL